MNFAINSQTDSLDRRGRRLRSPNRHFRYCLSYLAASSGSIAVNLLPFLAFYCSWRHTFNDVFLAEQIKYNHRDHGQYQKRHQASIVPCPVGTHRVLGSHRDCLIPSIIASSSLSSGIPLMNPANMNIESPAPKPSYHTIPDGLFKWSISASSDMENIIVWNEIIIKRANTQ